MPASTGYRCCVARPRASRTCRHHHPAAMNEAWNSGTTRIRHHQHREKDQRTPAARARSPAVTSPAGELTSRKSRLYLWRLDEAWSVSTSSVSPGRSRTSPSLPSSRAPSREIEMIGGAVGAAELRLADVWPTSGEDGAARAPRGSAARGAGSAGRSGPRRPAGPGYAAAR